MAKEVDMKKVEEKIKKKNPNYSPEFVEGSEFVWEDAVILYPQLSENNYDEYEGKQRYLVKVLIDEDREDALRQVGFNVRDFEGDKLPEELQGRCYLEAYAYKITTKGIEREAPPVYYYPEDGDDDEAVEFPNPDNIGNHTVADLNVFAKYTEVGGVWRLPLYLNGVLITELKEYGAGKRSAKSLFGKRK